MPLDSFSISPNAQPEADVARSSALADLRAETGADLGLTVADDGQVALASAAGDIQIEPGTAIVSGHLSTANPATGQSGGTVQVLGDRVALIDNAQIDASGDASGGTVLIGGDFQGKGAVPNARDTVVAAGVTLAADALNSGKGGKVIVWADNDTRFEGRISAKGGALAGDGGDVEVSGKHSLHFNGHVDTGAINGQTGTLLLDPDNITVVAATPTPPNATDGLWSFTEDPGTQTIGINAIQMLLGTADLTLQATNDIDVTSQITIPNTNSLTLEAGNNLQVAADITTTNGGDVNLLAGSDFSIGGTAEIRADGGGIVTVQAGNNIAVTDTVEFRVENGSTVNLQADNALTVANSAEFRVGNGSTVNLQADNTLTVANSAEFRVENGSTVNLQADNTLTVANGAEFRVEGNSAANLQANNNIAVTDTVAFRLEDGGSTSLQAGNNLALTDTVEMRSSNDGGDINLRAGSDLAVTDDAEIRSEAGSNINLQAGGTLSIDGGELDSQAPVNSPGGDITLSGTSVFVTNGGFATARTMNNDGNGGSITVNASDLVRVSGEDTLGNGSSLAASTDGSSDAGTLTVNTQRLLIDAGAQISTSAFGSGKGGQLVVNAADSVVVAGEGSRGTSVLIAETRDRGDAGSITVNTQRLLIDAGAQIATTTFASGQSGSITVNASESVQLTGENSRNTGSGLFAETRGSGNAGQLIVNTQQLLIQDGGQVNAASSGSGNGGQLIVNASESVQVLGQGTAGNPSFLVADTRNTGDAGELTINTRQLLIQDGGTVSTETAGSGEGGRLTVNASELVQVIGETENSATASRLVADSLDTGNAGELVINTRRLSIAGGGVVSTTAFESGNGGSLTVNASDSVQVSGVSAGGETSRLLADTRGSGNAGALVVNTGQLLVQDEAIVSTETSSTGNGGSLTVNASQSVEVSNGGELRAQSIDSGDAGNLNLRTAQLTVRDRADVTVSSTRTGGGGNLDIVAENLLLDNQGQLIAETAFTDGGNIRIDVDGVLLMRNESLISATAGGAGSGGNIEIEAGFVVAVPSENSDIIANAFEGEGGVITITTEGIFGLEFRSALTEFSDITASSDFGSAGTVALNTPTVDPSQGVTELPGNVVDPSNLVLTTCPVPGKNGEEALSEFFVTGRGGVPLGPGGTMLTESVLAGWVKVDEGGNREQGTGNREQGTNRVWGMGNGEQEIGNREPRTEHGEQGTGNGEQGMGNRKWREESSLFMIDILFSSLRQNPLAINSQPPIPNPQPLTMNPQPLSPISIVEARGWRVRPNGKVVLTAQPAAVVSEESDSGLILPGCRVGNAAVPGV